MRSRHHLLVALRNPGFRRLLTVRLAGQFGDGVFQASLAGTVLFNPERQASAGDVAAGFAVLLLPYSVIGPFAGVLIDRWSRQRVLFVTNGLRAAGVLALALGISSGLAGTGFYAAALVLVSLARFLLSALSASLPQVAPRSELVTANAFTTTAGAVAAALGGGAAIGVRAVLGSDDTDYAIIAAAAAVPFIVAAFAAAGFARDALGPTSLERTGRESARQIAKGLVAGLVHVWQTKPVLQGLGAITVHRIGYGITTVCTVLLYRNYFTSDGVFRAGLAGLTQVVAMIAAGGALAAVLTPMAVRRIGSRNWAVALLLGSAVVQLTCVLAYRLPLLLLAALLLGFGAQGIKIGVDTLVQQQIGDDYRGRVFSIYDTLFNVTLVIAAALTATVLPEDGYAPASVVVIAAGYVVTGLVYYRAGRAALATPK